MYIKMDRFGKNISVYNSLPIEAKHKGKNVYYDSYGNIYLEFVGSTTPVYKTYSGEIDQVGSIKIYYNYDKSVNQVGSYKVYKGGTDKVIEVAGVRI